MLMPAPPARVEVDRCGWWDLLQAWAHGVFRVCWGRCAWRRTLAFVKTLPLPHNVSYNLFIGARTHRYGSLSVEATHEESNNARGARHSLIAGMWAGY